MTTAPLISVVIPTHQRPRLLLDRALPSVLSQSHQNLQVLVVGDDAGAETIEALRAVTDARVTFRDLPKQVLPDDPGQAWCVLGLEARNWGLDHAEGEFVASLDDDDEWSSSDHLEVLLAAINATGAQFAYGKSIAHWADGHTSEYGNWPMGHFQFCDGAWLAVHDLGYRYDKGCIERGLPADGDLWDRMAAGGVKATFVPRQVHTYWPNKRD